MNSNAMLRANWKKGDRLSAAWLRMVSAFINTFSVYGGKMLFDGRRARLTIYANAGCPFYVQQSAGATVTVEAGKIVIIGRGLYQYAGGTVTVSAPDSWLVWQCSRSSPAAGTVSNLATCDPTDSVNYQVPIATVTVINGVAEVVHQWQTSNILIAATL